VEQLYILTPFTELDFLHFGTQLTRALQFLHHFKHIAHRDLKVGTVVTPQGRAARTAT
jgi:serine/threonine protein kinase